MNRKHRKGWILLGALAAAFALFAGGYHVGKDLAQRDGARVSAP